MLIINVILMKYIAIVQVQDCKWFMFCMGIRPRNLGGRTSEGGVRGRQVGGMGGILSWVILKSRV